MRRLQNGMSTSGVLLLVAGCEGAPRGSHSRVIRGRPASSTPAAMRYEDGYARGGGGSGAVVRLYGRSTSGATAAAESNAAGEKSLTISAPAVTPHVTAEPQVTGAHGTSQRPIGIGSCVGPRSDVWLSCPAM